MAFARMITQSTGIPTIEEWAKLDLGGSNSCVMRLTRVRYDDNSHPLGVEEVVLPLERFPGLVANGGDVPDIIELAQRHGLALGRSSERIRIVQSTKPIASLLGIAVGANVLKLERIAETADGQPIEWRVAFAKA
jgi:DNA-binding GntR family transcriptional regulator